MTRRSFFARLAAGVAGLLGVGAVKGDATVRTVHAPFAEGSFPGMRLTQADATGREGDLPIIDLTQRQVVVSNTSQERFWVKCGKDGFVDYEEVKPGESRAFSYAMIPVRERIVIDGKTYKMVTMGPNDARQFERFVGIEEQ